MTGLHSSLRPYMLVLGCGRYECKICGRIVDDRNGCKHGFRFFVPGRPLPKQSARFGKGRTWQPKAKTKYKQMLELMTREAWLKAGKPKIEPPFCVRLDFVFAWPKSTRKAKRETRAWRTERPDADNLAKMTLDSLSLIIPDDAAISELHITKQNGPSDKEGVTITIGQCEPDDTNNNTRCDVESEERPGPYGPCDST